MRAFTFGHVRQLERVLGECLTRAWAAGAGPGAERLVIDVDSFIGEVYGRQKQGAGFGYTRVRGLHPILACRADTGEVLQVRLRKGAANTQRGILRFTDELIARIGRANPAGGTRLLRADNGFWNLKLFAKLEAAGWAYSIGIRMTKPIRAIVDVIPDGAWQKIEDYPLPGEAQIAETKYGQRRMIVRRVRALPNAQSELFPAWFHYPFATNRTDPIDLVEREHRQHAVVELAIRDLKDQALAHFPSGDFSANSAWTVIAALAHNMMRWTTVSACPPNRPHRPHPAAPAAHPPRPPHPPRRHLDPAPPRPLALARRLHQRPGPHPGTRPGHLTAAAPRSRAAHHPATQRPCPSPKTTPHAVPSPTATHHTTPSPSPRAPNWRRALSPPDLQPTDPPRWIEAHWTSPGFVDI